MDNDVIVIGYCTHRAGLVDEYEHQLTQAGISFHLEIVEPMPQGANSITMRRRIDYWRRMVVQFKDYRTIYFTDAWDVLFYGSKQDLIDKASQTLMVSAERVCYPEYHLTDQIQGQTPWKYANNGMIVTSPVYLYEWLKEADNIDRHDILDQAWFNRRRAENSSLVPLDETTKVFYVVNLPTEEDHTLQVKDGRPWNSKCNTYPNFLHFSGRTPVEIWRHMLERYNSQKGAVK